MNTLDIRKQLEMQIEVRAVQSDFEKVVFFSKSRIKQVKTMNNNFTNT